MRKKKPDFTLLLHVIIVILIIIIIITVFFVGKDKKIDNITKDTEKMYQEKIENTRNVKPEPVINKELLKELKPFKKYKFQYTYTLNVQGEMKNVNFKIFIPSDEADRQYITGLVISPTPTRTYIENGNNVAEFDFNNVSPRKIQIMEEGIASVRTYDLKTAKILNKNITKEKDLSKYLKDEPMIESNDYEIRNIAKNIKGSTSEEIIQNTYEYVQNTITYKILSRYIGAKEVLKTKEGQCCEFSALMTAILRAKKIPARVVAGNIARDNMQKHSWVEVYFDKYGWVAFDPTREATVARIYKDGKLVGEEKRYNTDKSNLNYIASCRGKFSSWFITYSAPSTSNGRVSVSDDINIVEVK